METWPSSLTGFTDDFSIQPNTVAEKNMTDGGVNHAFSRWTSDIVEISGTLHYGQDDLATFKTFYRDTIKNGTEAFYLTDFPIFGDYETHEVVFKEHPDISYAAWMEWDVSVTLLSSDLGYMTEAAMTALLPEEPDDDYVTFPTSVFGEVTDDFGWQQDDLIARGNTDGGNFPFAKRISHVSSTTAQFGIEVSRVNMNLFYAWGLYKLAGFKKWFKVGLPYGGTTQTVPARFVEPPKASFKGRGDADEGLWIISGSLEIYEVNYWALEDCDSLPVRTEIVITVQPSNAYAVVGESALFTVVATGVSSYQWYFSNGSTTTAVDGATSSTLSFTSVAESNYGSYFCRLTDESGYFVNSEIVTLSTFTDAIWILQSDTNVTESSGAVSAWATTDSAYSFVQATSGIQPVVDSSDLLNGYAPIRFTNDFLQSSSTVGLPTGANPFTISCLLRCRDSSGTGGDTSYSYVWGYGSTTTSDTQSVALGNRVSSSGYWWVKGGVGTTIVSATSEVHLLTVSYDGTMMRLYVDSTLVGKAIITKEVQATSFVIGAWRCYTTERVADASIWELRALDSALSDGGLTTVGQTAASGSEIAAYLAYINNRYALTLGE